MYSKQIQHSYSWTIDETIRLVAIPTLKTNNEAAAAAVVVAA